MSQPLDVELADESLPHHPQNEEATTLLTPFPPIPTPTPTPPPKHHLTLLNGVSLVLGLQIGSGIFLTPSQVTKNVPNPGSGVLVWLLGGLLVWTGVCSFIELGTSIATNGGLQEYLRHCYGDFMGAFFSWTWVMIARSATMAVVTAVFAEYVCKAVMFREEVSMGVVKGVGLVGLWVMTVMNWQGPKAGADFANKFLVVKIGALVLIAVSGIGGSLVWGVGDGVVESPYGWFGRDPGEEEVGVLEQMGRFVTAMFAALFSYNGFESIGFVLGDVKDAARSLPRILHTAMTVVITGFILSNISLYMTLSMEELRSTNTPTISFASTVLGPIGRVVLSLVVAISALGSLNANLFATASLSVAASQRGYFPKVLGNTHCSSQLDEERVHDALRQRLGRYLSYPIVKFSRLTARNRWEKNVPIYAMTLNATMVSIYLVLGTYDDLVTFVGISQYLYYMLAVCGVFIIRRKESAMSGAELQGRYRTALWNPIIFIICSFFIVVRGILSNVAHGIALCLLGLVVWVAFKSGFFSRGHLGPPASLRGSVGP